MGISFSKKFLRKYAVTGKLGAGSMGIVFKGVDRRNENPVAIKILNPKVMDRDSFNRFCEEARISKALHHPNIVERYESGIDGKIPFLIFEYVEGASLRRYVGNMGHDSLEEILSIISKVLKALEYAHSLGVIHRDIKPDNILVSSSGDPKVADFGIARNLSSKSHKTKTGMILGTVNYMAPEQITDDSPGHSIDIYAVGVVLYELLTGTVPFEGSTMEVATALLKGDAPRVSEINPHVPKALSDIVAKAMQTDPKQRYQTAAEFMDAIDSYQSILTSTQGAANLATVKWSSDDVQSLYSDFTNDINFTESQGLTVAAAFSGDNIEQPGGSQGRTVASVRSVQGSRKATLPRSPSQNSTNGDKQRVSPLLISASAVAGLIVIALLFFLSGSFRGPDSPVVVSCEVGTDSTGSPFVQWQTSLPVRTIGQVRRKSGPEPGEKEMYTIESRSDRQLKSVSHKLYLDNLGEGDYQFRALAGTVYGEWVDFASNQIGGPVLQGITWMSAQNLKVSYVNEIELVSGQITANFGHDMYKSWSMKTSKGAENKVEIEDIRLMVSDPTIEVAFDRKGVFPSVSEMKVQQTFPSFTKHLVEQIESFDMATRLEGIYGMNDAARKPKAEELVRDLVSGKGKTFMALARKFHHHSKDYFFGGSIPKRGKLLTISLEEKVSLYDRFFPFLLCERMAVDYGLNAGELGTRIMLAMIPCFSENSGLAVQAEASLPDSKVRLLSGSRKEIVFDTAFIKEHLSVSPAVETQNGEREDFKKFAVWTKLKIPSPDVFVTYTFNKTVKFYFMGAVNDFRPANALPIGEVTGRTRTIPIEALQLKGTNTLVIEVSTFPWCRKDENNGVEIEETGLYFGI